MSNFDSIVVVFLSIMVANWFFVWVQVRIFKQPSYFFVLKTGDFFLHLIFKNSSSKEPNKEVYFVAINW